MKNLRNLFEGIFDAEDILSKSIEYIPHLDVAPLGRVQIQKNFNEYASTINDAIYMTGAQQILIDVQEKLNILEKSLAEYNAIYHPDEHAFSRSASVELQCKLGFMQKTVADNLNLRTDSMLVKNIDWFKERYSMIYNLMVDLHKKFPRDINVWVGFHMSQKPKPKLTIIFEVNDKMSDSNIDEVWKFAKNYKFSIKPTIKENDELKSLIWK